MKYLMILCLWLFSEKSHSQSTTLSPLLDNLQKGDTLYVNFCISHSEFGSVHKGMFLYKKDNSIFGRYVLYNYGVSLLPNKSIRIHPNVMPVAWEADSVISFYNKVKLNYFVLKNDWELDHKQVEYLKRYFYELEKFIKPEGFSNAPDFYTVMSKAKSFVVLDLVGAWDKYLEVYKAMGL